MFVCNGGGAGGLGGEGEWKLRKIVNCKQFSVLWFDAGIFFVTGRSI